jgi:hypothetical protein
MSNTYIIGTPNYNPISSGAASAYQGNDVSLVSYASGVENVGSVSNYTRVRINCQP